MTLLGQSLEQLQALCSREGFPKYSARQICHWLYSHRVERIEDMTNLSLKTRARLSELAVVGRHPPTLCQVSQDGTKKYLFDTVETVFIPDGQRATLCVSCQKGCRMRCRFCVTGQQGFHGNISTGDILNQLLSIPEYPQITNIVFMGMGEPMDNYDNVLAATQVLTSDWGLAWSPHRITISSVGIIPGLRRLIAESQCHIAISLHNPIGRERLAMMPMEKPYPIAHVVELLKQHDWHGQRRLTFEYTLFRGINDDEPHAAEVVRLLRGLNCRVNLIRFHSSPGTPYEPSTPSSIQAFENYLNNHGITCTLRASRGEDIMAACGLLAGTQNK